MATTALQSHAKDQAAYAALAALRQLRSQPLAQVASISSYSQQVQEMLAQPHTRKIADLLDQALRASMYHSRLRQLPVMLRFWVADLNSKGADGLLKLEGLRQAVLRSLAAGLSLHADVSML